MRTDWIYRCDCCGDEYNRGHKLVRINDNTWEDRILYSVRGTLALNEDGEDWLCSECVRLLERFI